MLHKLQVFALVAAMLIQIIVMVVLVIYTPVWVSIPLILLMILF